MSTPIPNGEQPAFPWEQSPGNQNNLGLTKRECFSAMALQGLLAMCAGPHINAGDSVAAARVAVMHADALLAELEKKP